MGDVTEMPFVIFLKCSEEMMVKRINKRANETAGDQ